MRKVAKDFGDVVVQELIVDAVAALLISTPDRFDVIVTTNMSGDILRTRLLSYLAASI